MSNVESGVQPGSVSDSKEKWKTAGQIFGLITVLMVFVSVILSIVEAAHVNGAYYLVTMNLGITCFISIIMFWWYYSGALGESKWWFMVLTAVVINLQCITSDVYVYHTPINSSSTTSAMSSTTRAVLALRTAAQY